MTYGANLQFYKLPYTTSTACTNTLLNYLIVCEWKHNTLNTADNGIYKLSPRTLLEYTRGEVQKFRLKKIRGTLHSNIVRGLHTWEVKLCIKRNLIFFSNKIRIFFSHQNPYRHIHTQSRDRFFFPKPTTTVIQT